MAQPDAAIAAAENDSMVLPRPTVTTLRDLSGHATPPSLLSGVAQAGFGSFRKILHTIARKKWVASQAEPAASALRICFKPAVLRLVRRF